MKKQYVGEYQHETYRKGEWRTATDLEGRKFFDNPKEAENAIHRAEEYFNAVQATKAMRIVKSRIRVRTVSEWETVWEGE